MFCLFCFFLCFESICSYFLPPLSTCRTNSIKINPMFQCMDHPLIYGQRVPMYGPPMYGQHSDVWIATISMYGVSIHQSSDVWIASIPMYGQGSNVWIASLPTYGPSDVWTLRWLPTWVFFRLPMRQCMDMFIRSPLIPHKSSNGAKGKVL